MTRPCADLAGTRLHVLLAVTAVHRRDGRATVRTVTELAGGTLSNVHHHLVELREAGWVAWEDGRDGTLRPLVTVVPDAPRERAGQRG